ncbi:MAG: hypothetical protein IT317_24775 [Anaerolineales bacterium]|nr:hypothetical protein [Anaerolineales bacterium]
MTTRSREWDPDRELARRARLGWTPAPRARCDLWRVVYGADPVPARRRWVGERVGSYAPNAPAVVSNCCDHATMWHRRDEFGGWEYALAGEPYLRPQDVDYATLTAWCYAVGVLLKHDGQALHNSGCCLFWFERDPSSEALRRRIEFLRPRPKPRRWRPPPRHLRG